MVHSEVYLNKYVVSIAPFSTPVCPDYSQKIQKTALFECFRFLIFHPFFQRRGGSADPICPYVWTPMHTTLVFVSRRAWIEITVALFLDVHP